MNMLYSIIGWTAAISIFEFVLWRIFYKKTIRICFITEPDLPFSQYFTIGAIALLAFIHAVILISAITIAHLFLW